MRLKKNASDYGRFARTAATCFGASACLVLAACGGGASTPAAGSGGAGGLGPTGAAGDNGSGGHGGVKGSAGAQGSGGDGGGNGGGGATGGGGGAIGAGGQSGGGGWTDGGASGGGGQGTAVQAGGAGRGGTSAGGAGGGGVTGHAGAGGGGGGSTLAANVDYRICAVYGVVTQATVYRVDRVAGTCTYLAFSMNETTCPTGVSGNGWCLDMAGISHDVASCDAQMIPATPLMATAESGTFTLSTTDPGGTGGAITRGNIDITLTFPSSADYPSSVHAFGTSCLVSCVLTDMCGS